LKSFYLNKIVYYFLGLASVVFFLSYFFPAFFRVGGLIILLLSVAILVDVLLVFGKKMDSRQNVLLLIVSVLGMIIKLFFNSRITIISLSVSV